MLTMNRMGAGSWCDIVEEEVRMGVAADIFVGILCCGKCPGNSVKA